MPYIFFNYNYRCQYIDFYNGWVKVKYNLCDCLVMKKKLSNYFLDKSLEEDS